MNQSIISFGNFIPINSEVITWKDPFGYDGYTMKAFQQEDRKTGKVVTKKGPRYSKERVKEKITQIVIHHSGGDGRDPSGMYQTLWFDRFLSVQFAVEDNGKVYQFLDTKETAWHAGSANGRSVGMECALFPIVKNDPHYYDSEFLEKRKNLPHGKVTQTIQGVTQEFYKMPDVQVQSVANLCAGIWYGLGRTEPPKFPRNEAGSIPNKVLNEYQMKAHEGLIGHFHLTTQKIDPAGVDLEILERLCAEAFQKYFNK